MFAEKMIQFMNGNVLNVAIAVVLPLMMFAFVGGVIFRLLIYFTVRRHEWFAKEFEKRVNKFIEGETPGAPTGVSFYVLTKRILERTYYELFEVRDRLHRRRPDRVMALSDRVFLIKQGAAWLVKDILRQVKFLKWNETPPKIMNITRNTFMQNPCFNKVFGIIPISGMNDIINILPSLFVIGGIFGTFLGIVKGLPKLEGMNLNDIARTKEIMDSFLLEISFAMNSSVIGIFFSVMMTMFNTVTSPEKAFSQMVDRFEAAMDLLWHRSDNNDYPKDLPKFDEHKDPVEALAEEALNTEVAKKIRNRSYDEVRKNKAG